MKAKARLNYFGKSPLNLLMLRDVARTRRFEDKFLSISEIVLKTAVRETESPSLYWMQGDDGLLKATSHAIIRWRDRKGEH